MGLTWSLGHRFRAPLVPCRACIASPDDSGALVQCQWCPTFDKTPEISESFVRIRVHTLFGSHPGDWVGVGYGGVSPVGLIFFSRHLGSGLVCMCEVGHTNILAPKDRPTGTLTQAAEAQLHVTYRAVQRLSATPGLGHF